VYSKRHVKVHNPINKHFKLCMCRGGSLPVAEPTRAVVNGPQPKFFSLTTRSQPQPLVKPCSAGDKCRSGLGLQGAVHHFACARVWILPACWGPPRVTRPRNNSVALCAGAMEAGHASYCARVCGCCRNPLPIPGSSTCRLSCGLCDKRAEAVGPVLRARAMTGMKRMEQHVCAWGGHARCQPHPCVHRSPGVNGWLRGWLDDAVWLGCSCRKGKVDAARAGVSVRC
jgi:hypothetical protein